MALSEQEQRLLDEMERSLYQNDADVVSTTPSSGPVVSSRSITIAVLAAAVGLAVVVAGMALGQPLIGLVGFVVLIAGVAWACVRGGGERGDDVGRVAAAPRPQTGATGGAARPAADGKSFIDRMEDRWERRRDGEL